MKSNRKEVSSKQLPWVLRKRLQSQKHKSPCLKEGSGEKHQEKNISLYLK